MRNSAETNKGARNKLAVLIGAFALIASVIIGCIFMINTDTVLVDADAELLEAVSQATLELNAESFVGEYLAEGHVIFGVKETDNSATVYMMDIVESYSFRNGYFMVSGGHTVPAVMQFDKTDNGYAFKSVEYAKDGSYYMPSIKKLFPSQLVDSVLNYPVRKSIAEESNKRCEAYAEKYLEAIGRDAIVCDYGDIEHVLLTEVGISVDVSNKLLNGKIPFDTEIGTYETVEDGVRYLFTTAYDADKFQIIFTKEVYETRELMQKMVVDSRTAEILSVYGLVLTDVSPEFDATVLEVYDGSILVSPAEYTDEARSADKITVSINTDNNPDAIEFRKGMQVVVVYDGKIAESYPAQISKAYLVYEHVEPQGNEYGLVPTTAQPIVVAE